MAEKEEYARPRRTARRATDSPYDLFVTLAFRADESVVAGSGDFGIDFV